MYSHRARTFVMILILLSMVVSQLLAAEPVFLGYGYDPQWSPSGKLIGAWRRDTLVVFDVSARVEIKTLAVERPKFFYWISEDTLALSYQGVTKGDKPRDRWPIVTRSIVTLEGSYTTILCDTVIDSRNSLSHWRQLPNQKVGIFRLVNDIRTKFLMFKDGQFVEVDPDTVARALCWKNAPPTATEYFPSLDCSRALLTTAKGDALILDVLSGTYHNIGRKTVATKDGRYTIMDLPSWAYDGSILSFVNFTEDGHYLYASEIVVVNGHSFESRSVASLSNDGLLRGVWSPVETVLLLEEEGTLLLWEPEN